MIRLFSKGLFRWPAHGAPHDPGPTFGTTSTIGTWPLTNAGGDRALPQDLGRTVTPARPAEGGRHGRTLPQDRSGHGGLLRRLVKVTSAQRGSPGNRSFESMRPVD